MAQATFSVRMDEDLKRQFDSLCVEFGMNATVAFNVFARAVVREKRIPFGIQAAPDAPTRADGLSAFLALRQQAKENCVQDLSPEEIEKEIARARHGERRQ